MVFVFMVSTLMLSVYSCSSLWFLERGAALGRQGRFRESPMSMFCHRVGFIWVVAQCAAIQFLPARNALAA